MTQPVFPPHKAWNVLLSALLSSTAKKQIDIKISNGRKQVVSGKSYKEKKKKKNTAKWKFPFIFSLLGTRGRWRRKVTLMSNSKMVLPEETIDIIRNNLEYSSTLIVCNILQEFNNRRQLIRNGFHFLFCYALSASQCFQFTTCKIVEQNRNVTFNYYT